MKEYQQRMKIRRLLHSRYAIAVLAILLALLVRPVWGIYEKYEKSKELTERARADLASLESREMSIAASIEALNTDEGRERELRDRFGVVKEGERMIVIVDEGTNTESQVIEAKKGWWTRFIEFLR